MIGQNLKKFLSIGKSTLAYSEMLLLIFNQMEEEVEYQPILQKQTVMVGTIDYKEL